MSESGEYRKQRNQTGVGKGDKRRPGDDKAYAEGWERIFGKKKEVTGNEKLARGPGAAPEFA
jgi:hypothetical protein